MNPTTDTPTRVEATPAESLARRYHAALEAARCEDFVTWSETVWEETSPGYQGRMLRAAERVLLAEETE